MAGVGSGAVRGDAKAARARSASKKNWARWDAEKRAKQASDENQRRYEIEQERLAREEERRDREEARKDRAEEAQIKRWKEQDERQRGLDNLAVEKHVREREKHQINMNESRARMENYLEAGRREAINFRRMEEQRANQERLMVEGLSGLLGAALQNPIAPGVVPREVLNMFNLQHNTDYDTGVLDMNNGVMTFTQPQRDDKGQALKDRGGNPVSDVALVLDRSYTTPLYNMFNKILYGEQFSQDAAAAQREGLKERNATLKTLVDGQKEEQKNQIERAKLVNSIRNDMRKSTEGHRKELGELDDKIGIIKDLSPKAQKKRAGEMTDLEKRKEELEDIIGKTEAPYLRDISELGGSLPEEAVATTDLRRFGEPPAVPGVSPQIPGAIQGGQAPVGAPPPTPDQAIDPAKGQNTDQQGQVTPGALPEPGPSKPTGAGAGYTAKRKNGGITIFKPNGEEVETYFDNEDTLQKIEEYNIPIIE